MKFKNMFSPIQIGPMTVKNRFVVPPMGNNFANSDGTWSDESVAYYGERAKGQFGLITIEATVVHKGAKGGPKKPCLYDDNSIESLKKITDACHEEGAKVSIQLQNAGPEGNAKNAGAPIQAATAIASADGRDIPEEVSTEKVYELVKGYGEAAERAMKGGADAVEIHMAHGYLVNSFMSPRTNKRVDEFGGNFENRMRFSRLIIEEVKKKTEGKIAVLARINSTEDMFGGLDNHDMCAVASYLEDCGIDTFAQAVLGATLEIPTIDGKVKYDLPEGTQTGTVFRLRGKGIPVLNGRGRGDQYVTVNVETPRNLTKEQKEALRSFSDMLGESNYEKRKSFFKKK